MRIHYLQHVAFEDPAFIRTWAEASGHLITGTHLYDGQQPPTVDQLDWLVVMGGPLGVHDERQYPWLVEEKRYIEACLEAGKTVVGICLGAQLVAERLGASVRRADQREIGWWPVALTDAARGLPLTEGLDPEFMAFHWHSDTFEIPAGAVHLARSAGCETQGFLFDGRVLGLQCHLEVTPRSVQEVVANCGDQLTAAEHVQTAERILGEDHSAEANRILEGLLERLPPERVPPPEPAP